MDSAKIKTLDQVHDALDVVEDARADLDLQPADKLLLEKASVQLRNLERTIIKQKEQELVEGLKTDCKDLTELIDQMKKSAESLAKIAGVIEKANKIVEDLINVVAKAVSVGLV